MSKGLEALKKGIILYDTLEKELKALEIIKVIFNIQVLGDYLIAQRGDVCVVENLKLRQSQELINLLKEVLL